MDSHRTIAAALAFALSYLLDEVPADPRKAHSVTEKHANITDSFSPSRYVDHTDANDHNDGIDVSI